jgi:diguanylate cyclase (GGDEF)-like protein
METLQKKCGLADKGGKVMLLKLAEVFDEYPNPLYIVKPIIVNGKSDDFEYVYVNRAFSMFVGRSRNELVGHKYSDNFTEKGESIWLSTFVQAAVGKKHMYVENLSIVINKIMYTEVFHVEPDMCGCIIHDFKTVSDDLKAREDRELRNKANSDSLTGFYNRFYLREMYGDISQKTQIGITYLDINNLKMTNDALGHSAGDRLIIKVSDLIRERYKNSMVFRVGGDEFVIITIGKGENDFLTHSEESRKAFEKENIAAIGYCYYEKVKNLKECIDYCDTLMYEHKRKMKRFAAD